MACVTWVVVVREIVSEDIEDFEYTPLPKYEGPFKVMNLPDERAMLRRWIEHVQELRPQIWVTYNGDFFDWPFLDARMRSHGIDMSAEIGVSEVQGEYRARCAVHLDAFHWVKRDSYLPQGAQGLKSVTKHKLGTCPRPPQPTLTASPCPCSPLPCVPAVLHPVFPNPSSDPPTDSVH